MRTRDQEIWARFIEKNPNRFFRVWYDWHVGEHQCFGETCDNCESVGWYDLTRCKIDVVAEDDKAIYIIEIKPNAGAGAVGQALEYAQFFREDEKPRLPVIGVVLTDTINKNTARFAAANKVEMWTA